MQEPRKKSEPKPELAEEKPQAKAKGSVSYIDKINAQRRKEHNDKFFAEFGIKPEQADSNFYLNLQGEKLLAYRHLEARYVEVAEADVLEKSDKYVVFKDGSKYQL